MAVGWLLVFRKFQLRQFRTHFSERKSLQMGFELSFVDSGSDKIKSKEPIFQKGQVLERPDL